MRERIKQSGVRGDRCGWSLDSQKQTRDRWNSLRYTLSLSLVFADHEARGSRPGARHQIRCTSWTTLLEHASDNHLSCSRHISVGEEKDDG